MLVASGILETPLLSSPPTAPAPNGNVSWQFRQRQFLITPSSQSSTARGVTLHSQVSALYISAPGSSNRLVTGRLLSDTCARSGSTTLSQHTPVFVVFSLHVEEFFFFPSSNGCFHSLSPRLSVCL